MELQQLLKECRQGSITAQKYLFDRYSTPFFLLCRRYMKTDASAEEMLMNGFLKVFGNLAAFEYTSEVASVAWMKRIMVNECLQELRKKNSFLVTTDLAAADARIPEEAISNLSAAEIFRLIGGLPTGYRTVFNLYVMEGISHKEIAGLLGITEGTSKSQLSKARAMLQQLLTQKEMYVKRKSR